jgi:glycosyltransferase involved in cell wall biosynthesis
VAAPTAAIVSFRLGSRDGVSVEAAKWAWALERLGWQVRTVAGEGPVDTLLPGLAIDAPEPPGADEVAGALAGAELVVVENLCSLPLNPAAAQVVSQVLRGRPALLHHHDLPWQRARFARWPPPPDDPRWVHVTVNDLSRRQLAHHGIEATVLRNCFDTEASPGDRRGLRRALGIDDGQLLVLQPTRAIARKNVGAGIALAERLGAVYWLTGPAEEGYGAELGRLLARAGVRTVHGAAPGYGPATPEDAYAAADVVVLPSSWEGFGNPAVESAVHRRPLAIGRYPVAEELAAFGFRWFGLEDHGALRAFVSRPDEELLEHNLGVARAHFSLADLPARLEPLVALATGRR